MSTFLGRFIEEGFECISIDYFDKEVFDSNAFFLSHYHSGIFLRIASLMNYIVSVCNTFTGLLQII